MIEETQALVNVSHQGQNGDLPDPVSFDAADGDVLAWASEALRAGDIQGIDADPEANLTGYVVEKYNAKDGQPNRFMVRAKTAFG